MIILRWSLDDGALMMGLEPLEGPPESFFYFSLFPSLILPLLPSNSLLLFLPPPCTPHKDM